MKRLLAALAIFLITTATAGCYAKPSQEHPYDQDIDQMPGLAQADLADGQVLRVLATTSIVADVVKTVGGDRIEATTLLPLGTDPHAFEPTPQDVAALATAHVVFANGAGLEEFLDYLLESSGEAVPVVPVSYGVELLELEASHATEGVDPHTWFDPLNVIVWVHNVEYSLAALDPAGASSYRTRAEAYEAELLTLHSWIEQQVAQVAEANRKLVTDHASFGYFAERYGFEQIGTVFPGYSTLSEPSAQELAELEDSIEDYAVQAVFVGLSVNPDLAERVAEDTGADLVFLYTGSLSEPDGPANSYVALMEYDTSAIVSALR
jgi:ABC-type Zn uptake system ZnuABC Zn-binding protein ZnuA